MPGLARRASGALLAVTAALLLAPPARAAETPPPRAPGEPIGGLRLGETGVILDRVPGLPDLPRDITAKSWLVADLDTGAILAARDPHARHRPASTLKTLTALTLIPKVDAAGRVPFTAAALAGTAQRDGVTSKVGLEVGRSYPAKRLFEAMVALSANDAAEALASAYPGGRAAALQAMNDEARHLQANDTTAATPSGLDAPAQFTSAYDLALLARAALALPEFRAYSAVQNVAVPSSKGVIGGFNHNRLLNSYKGAYAGKDGYTTLAGQVWWGAAQRGGHHLAVVVVDAGFGPVTQEIRLLDWGFAALPLARPVGQLVGVVPPGGLPVTAAPAGPPVAGEPAASAQSAGRAAVKAAVGGTPWGLLAGAGGVLAAAFLVLRRRAAVAGRTGRSRSPRSRALQPSGPPSPSGRHRPETAAPLVSGSVKVLPAPVIPREP